MTAPLITPEHRQQVSNWRSLVRLLAVSLVVSLLMLFGYVWRTETSRHQAEKLQSCRSQVAADLSAAQADNDLAFNQLVVALTDPLRRPYKVEIQRITDTGRALEIARDARVEFEKHPSGRC